MNWRRLGSWFVVGALMGACAAEGPAHEGVERDDEVEEAGDAQDLHTVLRGVGWSSAGRDLNNTRSQPSERVISPYNASRLGVKWVFETEGDVWATPAVDEASVYVPDGKGNLFAVDKRSGKLRWRRRISDYTGVPNVVARATPTIVGDILYLGDHGGRYRQGATLFAVDKRTGEKLWATKVDKQELARITASPVAYGDRLYVGISSTSESFSASTPGFKCCDFRGSVVAVDRHTGEVVWQRFLVPGAEAPGYSGVAVWGGNFVVDPARNALYVTTGNNLTVPTAVLDCQALPTAEQVEACTREVPGAEDNHFDSVVSLDLDTGNIKWAHAMLPFDTWSTSCVFAVPGNEGNCTNPHGEDYDFGQGPILYTATVKGRRRQLLGAGQKSGVFWALDPDDGEVVWSTQVGPGGNLGGLEWGSAYDGKRIYTAVANSGRKPWKLPSGEETTSGFWAALDPATGKILWQTRGTPAVTTANQGAVSVANGVVYGGTINVSGTMYALDAATGRTLWHFESGGSIDTAPAIVDGVVYWGSGYGVTGLGLAPNNLLFAFAPNAHGTVPVRDAGADAGDGGPRLPPGLDGSIGVRLDGGLDSSAGGAPTWSAIFTAYFGGPDTAGHCANCHLMTNAHEGYAFLAGAGMISGTSSKLVVPGQSPLTWFGGGMPPGGPTSLPKAEADLKAWVAAGALDN